MRDIALPTFYFLRKAIFCFLPKLGILVVLSSGSSKSARVKAYGGYDVADLSKIGVIFRGVEFIYLIGIKSFLVGTIKLVSNLSKSPSVLKFKGSKPLLKDSLFSRGDFSRSI